MEYLDVVDEAGVPIGEVVSREAAHAHGIRHRTAHVWVTRKREGVTEVLLQRRSPEKESHPGLFDTSSAGHIAAGDEPLPSAQRELEEELGISSTSQDLAFLGTFRIRYDKHFHGRAFSDNEVTFVYRYTGEVDEDSLVLQAEEVSEVRWFPLADVVRAVESGDERFCVTSGGLGVLTAHLASQGR